MRLFATSICCTCHYLASILAVIVGTISSVGAGDVDYTTQIRPLLSDKCFQCHGPDENTREADVRLDTEEGLRSQAGDDGSYESLIERITSEDPDFRMPPPEANKDLQANDIDLIRDWLASGADWQQHWAFVPPTEYDIPRSPNDQWSRTGIDRFLFARMETAGLEPSADAEPLILVRRLFLDLIGLPPSPEEADQWVDRIWSAGGELDEGEYQSLISSLLDRPAYGERWARKWLDLARYADTNGYEKDRERSIWPYRDWVIHALNDDMPFDQFTIEQLAGDMLENPTESQLIATGFHRNTMLNEEGGIDPLEFRYHAMTDRVATTGTTWLGLTLGCCQCHTHKYDPVSHTEYFQVLAFLNNADEPEYELTDPQLENKWAENRKQAEKLIAELKNLWPLPKEESADDKATKELKPGENAASRSVDLAEQQTPTEEPVDETEQRKRLVKNAFEAWLKVERKRAASWRPLKPIEATSNLPLLTIEEDDAIFASGDTAKRDDYYIVVETGNAPVTAIQLEALPDARLPERGPGSTYYEGTRGDFFLTEIDFSIGEIPIEVTAASESFAANRFGKNPVSAALTLDDDVQTGWSVHGRQGERHVAVFNLAKPLPARSRLSIHMVFGRHFASSLGRFRFRGTSDHSSPKANDFDATTTKLLCTSQDSLTKEEVQRLERAFLLSAGELKSHSEKIRRLLKRPDSTTTLVMRERPESSIRPTHRHHRGEYLQPAELVIADVPDVLPPLGMLPANRLGFAKWLVDPEHPLTSRVVVNRAWADFFGTGLVKTVNDFGLQGEAPSHPGLLDWLARRFVFDDKWSMKSLHRRIVSSRVYRQSSKFRADSTASDPDNRLLSFLPRTRLDAEVIRDRCLASSLLLHPKMGGPPVRPPQPAGVTEDTFGSPKWKADSGVNRYRRSIYTFQKRTAPFAMFATFDAPSGEACVARRDRSNSPLQALTILNDSMFIEFAQAAAQRLDQMLDQRLDQMLDQRLDQTLDKAFEFASPETDAATAKQLFRNILTRFPSDSEIESMLHFVAQQRERLATAPERTNQILGIADSVQTDGPFKDDSAADQELKLSRAAWTLLARSLYGLDEFQTRD
ncbi:MAG: PSD1 and planctomycete cytochrome C domain-containing protein [Aureliella sp.]